MTMATKVRNQIFVNLEKLQRSRKKPNVGDVFAIRPKGQPYLFGRVICTNAEVGGFPRGILIYLYKTPSPSKTAIPELRLDELLVAPLATNRLPWTHGYFETVSSRPLSASDRLRAHCFRDFTGRYFDEMGRPLSGPVEPVGEFGLQSFRTIDDLVSDALGIERAHE